MRALSIVGGIYLERCVQPLWNAVYGSAGRAAQAVTGLVSGPIKLHSYVTDSMMRDASRLASDCNAVLERAQAAQSITFDYLHPLATPTITPIPSRITQHAPILVTGEVVLRYGMLEGDAAVDSEIAIYDPQSAFAVPRFEANGSQAKRLAIIMNRREARAMTGLVDPQDAANALIGDGADVVVIKQGAKGALLTTSMQTENIPLYRTDRVWKLGSGDVFSATFAALWGCQGVDPARAADLASRATAHYCETRSLPVLQALELDGMTYQPVTPGRGRIYLAGPFFDLGQRWLVEEAQALLRNMGAEVFSPVHEVGPGPADIIAPEDVKGLEESQVVFAILNGLDPGTIFETGYAVKRGLPVVALAQNIKEEDLKMIVGTGCRITDDFATAIYHAIWALPA